ncbi:hypothetical protein Malapachy_1953 [Malassezia pachydermatis]|uniref:Uncharacterized protein n=1 Tax=Malassezia pachydermatis TaxID=77020 RepID=A0A0M8MNQ3_9BASI|nr:hypothetical protein Malapachy_1953 [Malassezia pachydermatis]KOS13787.1 hypothetical protein Malapachy_1953 [Malassezia pachydermatis]
MVHRVSSIVKEDVDVDATAAPSVVESEKDEASMSDEDKVLQARLDAELAATESALREHEQAMTSLTMSERKKIAQTIGEMRKESVIKIPERLDMVLSNGLDQGISSVFIRTLRAFGALASKIGNMDAPSDSWEEKAQALVAKELDTLVEVYDEIREKVRYVLYASREMEQELIQESVAKVRALSREAVRGFFDVMEKVEFQVTYFENEGWDSAMRRRGRFHREAIERDLMAMSSLGDLPDDNAVTMAPNLAEETKQINTGVDQLFKQAEHGFTALCDRMTQDPSILSDEAKYALLLIDMHAHLDMLAHLVEQQQRSAMLRLRETIGDLREYFNMTRVPPSGALHDIADFPLPVTPSQDTDSPEGVLDVPVPVPEVAEDMAIPSATPAAGAGLDDEDAQPSVTMTSTAPASASPSSDEISSLDDDSLTSDILEEALTTSSEPEPTHAAELGEDNVLSAEPESHSITESESTVTSTWTVEDAFTTSDPATLTLDPSVLTSEEMAMPTDADVFPFVDDVRDLSPDAMLSTVIDTLPTETLEPMAGIETWPPHSDVSASVIVDISSPVAETQQPTASVTLDVQHGDMDDVQEMTRTSSHQAPSMRKVARMPRSSSSSELHASSAVSHDEL